MRTLEVNKLCVEIGENELLHNISFYLEPGTGKSTLMKTIQGIMDKTSGQIVVNEKYDLNKHFII